MDKVSKVCSRICDLQIPLIEKQILLAAVSAMRDEFADVSFDAIPAGIPNPLGVLSFFCDCVRHHWARVDQGGELTPCSYTSREIHCPLGDGEIIALIQRFEKRHGPIWTPVKTKAKARIA